MAFLGSFETAAKRLARLRSALESTAQSMGDTVTQAVDLESRRRAMEDNLRRFREVEQQQNLQFPQPPRQPGIPSLIEDVFRQTGRVAGGPGTEEAFLPENVGGLAPPIPSQLLGERERQAELFRRLIAQGVDPEEAEQRVLGGETFTRGETVTPEGQLRLSQGLDLRPQDTTAPGTTQDVVGQLPFGVQELERARERFTAPIAALGLQGVESPIGSAVPVVPPAKAIQAIAGPAAEALGGVDGGIQLEAVRLGLKGLEATLPRERTLDEAFEGGIVNPFAAIAGDKEEQDKAQAVLEEAGLPRALAAEVLFDPLNLLPGVGFTKVDDVARLGRLVLRATRAVPEARAAAVATLRESGQFRRLLRTVSEEAGGGPLRGGEEVGGEGLSPLQSGIQKLNRTLRLTTQRRMPLELQRTAQRVERVASERQILDNLLEQGIPPEEAIPRARAAFRGEMAKAEGVLLDLTEVEQDAFWKVLTEHPLSFERQRGFGAVMKLMAEEPLQPNEVALLRRLYGDEFADIAEAVGAERQKFLKELGEDFPRKLPAEKTPQPGDLDFAQLGDKPPRIKPPLRRRVIDEMLELLKVRQVFMTVLDVSFGFRQAAKLGARRPKEWVQGMKWGMRMIRNEADGLALDAAQRADDRLVTVVTPDGIEEIPFGRIQTESADILRPIPGTPEAEAAGILTREESAITNKLSRIWGIRQSQQSFVLALNKMRGDVLWQFIKTAEKQGRPITPEFLRDMGNLLNRMTGRGELGQNWLAKAMKQLGFAPGYRISGPQMVMQLASRGKPHSGFIRRQAAESLAAWFGAGITLMGLAKVTGVADRLGLDPLSSEFGKIGIGPVRYNIWGTDSVLARHIAQYIWETRRDPLTGAGKVARGDVFWRYIRSGADPNVSTVVDLGTGKNFLGEPAGFNLSTLRREVENSFPLGLQDIKDILDEDGWIHALLGAPFAAGGVGISAYESDRQRLAAAYNRHVEAGDFGPNAPLYKDVGTALERRDNINKFKDLQELAGELESSAITVRNSRSEELLKFAEAAAGGVPGAARNYHENRGDVMTFFAGVSENEFADLNITLTGADNEILSQVYDVDFTEDRDNNGIRGDDEDVRLAIEEQDALKAKLSEPVQEALQNPENFFPDEEVVEVEERRNAALDQVGFLFDNISKYHGATVEESEQTDEYVAYVRQIQDNKLREFGDAWGWTLPELAIEMGKEDGQEELGQWASWTLSNQIRRNDEYDQYLIKNQEIIAPFFPFMYNRTVFREAGVLTDAIWNEVNVPIENPVAPTGR